MPPRGATLLATLLIGLSSVASASAEQEDRVVAGHTTAAGAKRLDLAADVGAIEVDPGEGEQVTWRVALEAKPSASSWFASRPTRADVRAKLDEVAVEATQSGDALRLRLKLPRKLDDDDFEQRWTVTVPARFAAVLEVDVGRIQVHGIGGGVRAEVDVGGIVIDVPKGSIDGSVDVGDIGLSVADSTAGDIDLETNVGGIDLELDGRKIPAEGGYGPGETLRLSGKGGDAITLRTDVGKIHVVVGR